MKKLMTGILILSAMSGSAFALSGGKEKFFVNQVKLVNFFSKKLNQPLNLKDFAGEWLKSERTDAIYPGGCHPALIFKDPNIEQRAEFYLKVDVDAYATRGGPEMNITSKLVGDKMLLLDKRDNYGLATFKGSLVKWAKRSYDTDQYCVVVSPSEISELTALPYTKPSREFLLCKTPGYVENFDPKGQCVEERYDPEVEFSSDEIDTKSARCIEIGLKNPCTHYNIYVRNH
jgi:hypothetical protein